MIVFILLKVINESSLRELFSYLLAEITLDDELVPDSIESIVMYIIIMYFRKLTEIRKIKYEFEKPEKSFLCYKIINYIDQNILSIKSLTQLEDEFHYNYKYLSRCFYSYLNITLSEYYINKKMEKAAELLTKTEMTVTKIAEILNYSSIHSFTHAFVKYFKIPPVKYRDFGENT